MAKKRRERKKTTVTDAYLKKYCNLVPDRLDPRDQRFMAMGPMGAAALRIPKNVDYSNETKPVGDQGNTGSCVGWASAYGLRRWLHFKDAGQKKKFSVRFVWMSSKEIDQWTPNVVFDLAGTSIRDAFKVMRKYGSCSDNLWPFNKQLPDSSKEENILLDALDYRIGNYHSLDTNDERKAHLAKQGPFVVGVPVYSNWSTIGNDGLVPDPSGAPRGGHAVLVVGYDNDTERFKFQNSWGTSWGKNGFGFFTYDYMENHSWNSWGAQRI